MLGRPGLPGPGRAAAGEAGPGSAPGHPVAVSADPVLCRGAASALPLSGAVGDRLVIRGRLHDWSPSSLYQALSIDPSPSLLPNRSALGSARGRWASPDLGTPHLKHFSRRLKFWTPHCEAQARPSEGAGISHCTLQTWMQRSPRDPAVPQEGVPRQGWQVPSEPSDVVLSTVHLPFPDSHLFSVPACSAQE